MQEEKTRCKEIYLGTAHYKLHHIVVEKRCMQQAYLSTSACGLASWLAAYLVVFLHLRMNPKNDWSSHLTTSRAPISYSHSRIQFKARNISHDDSDPWAIGFIFYIDIICFTLTSFAISTNPSRSIKKR